MTSEAPDSVARRQRRQLLVLLIAAAAGATALVATLLWSARADALLDAQVTALNYARTIAVRLDATLRRADSILVTLARDTPADALAAQAAPRYAALLDGRLDTMLRGFDEIMALRLVDAKGDQRYASAAGNAAGANYADRAFFRRLAQEPAAGLQISEVVTGRVSGRPTIVMARALRDREGRFIGAALAPVELSFFQQQFRKLDVGPRGAVFVRRVETGRLVLRWPPLDEEADRPMPASHPILLAVRAGHAESLDRYRAYTDGVNRISGTVAIQGYPLFLTVALSEDDVLANWRRLALLTGLGWSALLLLLFVLQWRLWHLDVERGQLAAQLRESQRIESIGTLAGGIAHDFNNILAAILGNVALARRDPRDEAQVSKSLAQIRTAAQRGRELVQQILAFGRRQPHALLGQPLQPLVEETIALLEATLPASVELDWAPADQPLYARVDATQMQQVLMNLCTNAWHALQGRPGHILLGLEPLDLRGGSALAGVALAPGRYAHLWVHDTGVGMDAATRERVFEPFFTTKPAGQGSGLGLSVVYGIVSAHKGAIRIESEPGRGTTVHLYLPTIESTPPPSTLPGTQPVALVGAGQQVLYVDDDEVICVMARQLLENAGYRVSVFNDGREAVAALRARPEAFDIVVTDHNMPGFGGIEVARAAAELRPTLPVLMISGYISDELREQAGAVGVRRLVEKQYTVEDLARAVREVLDAEVAAERA